MSDEIDIELIMSLGEIALDLGKVNRATFHQDGATPESDTTHTVMLGLIVMELAPYVGVDAGSAAQYAIVHDLVEAIAGDTNTFDPTEKTVHLKKLREAEAFNQLREQFRGTHMIALLNAYEAQLAPGARLVRFVDKMLPKITHALNGCAAIKGMGKSRDDLERAHGSQTWSLLKDYPEFAGPIADLFVDLCERSEAAY